MKVWAVALLFTFVMLVTVAGYNSFDHINCETSSDCPPGLSCQMGTGTRRFQGTCDEPFPTTKTIPVRRLAEEW